jgi:hypothetical protein
MKNYLVRVRNRSNADSLGVGPLSVTPHLAPVIARRCIALESPSNVLLWVVRQGNSYLDFKVLDTYRALQYIAVVRFQSASQKARVRSREVH